MLPLPHSAFPNSNYNPDEDPIRFRSGRSSKMIPEKRILTHPGEVLREEFLAPLGVPQTALATKLNISERRINEIVNGKRGVTPETAWLLAGAFGTTPEFWTSLPVSYTHLRAHETGRNLLC